MKLIAFMGLIPLMSPFNTNVEHFVEKNGVEIFYPCFIDRPQDQTQIADFISGEKKNFLGEYESGNTLLITYTSFIDEKYCGFLFNTLIDTHGAHPNTTLATLNFSQTAFVDPETLFTQKDYAYFSQFCAVVLKAKLQLSDFYIPEMLDDGIKPVAENFRNVILQDESLTFYFQQYQVAPYAAGIQSVTIPYNLQD